MAWMAERASELEATAKQTVSAHKSDRQQQFYVTRESQENKAPTARKESYVGLRNLVDLEKIKEEDIVSRKGTIRGIKNRVRAGLANFENPKALFQKSQEEGKVVIYITTFRGVRSTFEECKYVLTVFHNLRVRVEERDVYVHKFYLKELEERLKGKRCSVPQVFISGQHIGGKHKLEELNEAGELRRLLADFPRYETAKDCQKCGGYGFVLCHKCGGSKNSISNNFTGLFRALRCTYCNENGLEPCSACTIDTGKQGGGKEDKQADKAD